MPIFRGSKDATVSTGDIVATQADIANAVTLAEEAQAASEAAQAAAEAALDNFDDRYLGAKSSDPTVDNDGDPLIDGAIYFNTVENITKIYDLGTTTWISLKPLPTEQANINTVAGIADDVTTVAGIDTDVTTVSGISGDVTIVSGISTDVTTVLGISSDVTAVATNDTNVTTVATDIANVNTVAGIDADVATVAGISGDVTTVSGISTDVTTVSGIDTDVTTVSGISSDVTIVSGISADVSTVTSISSDVTIVADNIADVTNFADVYIGPAASDPTTRTDGSPLQDGDLYFNTTDDRLKVYDGAAWDVTARLDAEVRGLFSAAGDLTYNSSTGEFSFTETPNYTDADVDAHLTGGTGVTYTAGTIAIGQDVGTSASVTFLDAEFTGTGAVELPEGTELQRPGTPAAGMIRFNSDVSSFEGYDGSAWGEIGGGAANGLFSKTDSDKVAWTKTGNDTAETSQTIYVEVGGEVLEIASGTNIAMPTLTAGTDYAIWVAPDGTLEADTSFTTAPTAGGRKIGGFHYAPGGNATGTSGGNTTNQINEYSFWDLKFRPTCEDPRGMTLVADGFWADIYLLNTNPDVNGTSAFGVTIADNNSPPIIPAAFGGNGSTTYGSFKWYECQEVFAAYGKKAPTYAEFMALAYGVTEETDRGSDPGTTQLDAARTSKWGVIQATGNMRVWGRDVIGDGTGSDAWRDIAEGRGEIYTYNGDLRAGGFGGFWGAGAQAGSRSSLWRDSVADSGGGLSGRGVADHLVLP